MVNKYKTLKRYSTDILGLTLAVCIVAQWAYPALISFVALTLAGANEKDKV